MYARSNRRGTERPKPPKRSHGHGDWSPDYDRDVQGGASTLHGGGEFSPETVPIRADILERFSDDLDRVLVTWIDQRGRRSQDKYNVESILLTS